MKIGLVVFLSQAAAVSAQPAEDPEALIQVGNGLRRKGDNLRAIGYFRRAYELAHTPRSAAQLGLVELAVSDYVNAEAHLSEALAANDPWVRSNAKTVEDSRKKARANLLRVEIVGAPADATVVVPERGIVKLSEDGSLWLAPGTAKLKVQAIGHRPAEVEVAGAAKETRTVRVDMPQDKPAPIVAPVPAVSPPPAAPPASDHEEGQPPRAVVETAPVPGAASPGRGLRIAGIATGAAGVAVAVVGGVLLAQGNAKADSQLAAQTAKTPWNPDDANYQTLQKSGVGLLIGGGVAVAAGVAMFVVGSRAHAAETTSVSVAMGPGGGVLGFGGSF